MLLLSIIISVRHLSFVQKQIALDDLMYRGAHSISGGVGVSQNFGDLWPMGKLDRCTGRVDHQLPGQVPRELCIVLDEDLLQFSYILKAASVRQLSSRVYRRAHAKVVIEPVMA